MTFQIDYLYYIHIKHKIIEAVDLQDARKLSREFIDSQIAKHRSVTLLEVYEKVKK
jgi:hypothetical protein